MAGRIKLSPARICALDVVREVRERNAYVQNILESLVDNNTRLSSEDRAFATRLAIGVVQTVGTLDDLINRALSSPKDVKPNVRDALQIATYEIIYLKKAPHAAVSQGVELVHHITPKATKLANYVLRRVADQARPFPFGNPSQSIEAAARLYGFPLWLAQRLQAWLGPAGARSFMEASNEPAPLFVAVNSCKCSEAAAAKVFEQAGEPCKRIALCQAAHTPCFRLEDSRALLQPTIKRALSQGKLVVADAAAQMVVANALPATMPKSVLEVGAGRGTKTLLFQANAQARYGQQLEAYTTLDVHEFKTQLLLKRVQTHGVTVHRSLTADATGGLGALGGEAFDFVFVDAPCSGLGTLRRHPEIRWRVTHGQIENFARTQLAMLTSASLHVSPAGRLVYSTCSIAPEENLGVVKAFLSSPAGAPFRLVPIARKQYFQTRLAPGSSDAHFAACFQREA